MLISRKLGEIHYRPVDKDMEDKNLEEFCLERSGWLEVMTMKRPDRNGYDIILRLDGTYYGSEDSVDFEMKMRDLVIYWTWRLEQALRVEAKRNSLNKEVN